MMHGAYFWAIHAISLTNIAFEIRFTGLRNQYASLPPLLKALSVGGLDNRDGRGEGG